MMQIRVLTQVIFLILFSYPLQADTCSPFTTYFSYSDEGLKNLEGETSSLKMNKKELEKWDKILEKQYKNMPASFESLRIHTYLYIAQLEVAKLSYKAKGRLEGSLDPVSYAIISTFLPEIEKPEEFHEDPYSFLLSNLVKAKMIQRIKTENDSKKTYGVPSKMKDLYFVGLTTSKWMPWYAIPTREYWPPQPPNKEDPFWKNQVERLRAHSSNLSQEKKEKILLWAGMNDPTKSDCVTIANSFLFSHEVPLFKLLTVRAALMFSLYDATIVSFSSKYHYLVMRPSAYDDTLDPEIPVPGHPSYPSNHSVTFSAVATILSFYFPDQASHWRELADEASISRLWAKVHYPTDDEEGKKAGKKVALNVLNHIDCQSVNESL